MHTPLADYECQQAAFAALLEPGCRRPILLFCGESGSGKTALVYTCLQKVPAHIPHVPIQLRGSAASTAEIFYRAGARLGWNAMAHFTAQVAELQGMPDIHIDSNWLTGINNRISVALRAEKPADREERCAALTEAWFNDLKALPGPVLMALDTYEQATEEVARWIDGPLLARVAHCGPLRVLIAGQRVPDVNNIEWGDCCTEHHLCGVPEAKYWLPIVEAMGRTIPVNDPESWLAGVCHALKGRPKDIIQVIEGLPRREAAA